MSDETLAFHAPFRQRAPCGGLLISAVIGIIVSDAQPGCWILWSVASLLPTALICKIRCSFLAYSSVLLLFASWHGYQVETNSGYSAKLACQFRYIRTYCYTPGADGTQNRSVPFQPKVHRTRHLRRQSSSELRSLGGVHRRTFRLRRRINCPGKIFTSPDLDESRRI